MVLTAKVIRELYNYYKLKGDGRGGVHPELEKITKQQEDLARFPKQKKSRLEEDVGEGTKELDKRAGFTLKPSDEHTGSLNPDGTVYKIQVKTSPKYPNIRLITYTLTQRKKEMLPHEIGHRIVLNLLSDEKYEYYNSTGQVFAELPPSVKDVANMYGRLVNYKNETHQENAPICERHSINRACFAGTNAEYNAMIASEAKKTGKSFDEYVWDKTKGELLRPAGKGRGGMMKMNPLAAASPAEDAKKVIERILKSANQSRAMSIAIKEGHKSIDTIMNEAAMELFKAGKAGAVQYLNDLRAPFESHPDYKKEDSTARNKIAAEMGLVVAGKGRRGGISFQEFDDDNKALDVGIITPRIFKNLLDNLSRKLTPNQVHIVRHLGLDGAVRRVVDQNVWYKLVELVDDYFAKKPDVEFTEKEFKPIVNMYQMIEAVLFRTDAKVVADTIGPHPGKRQRS
jgi:hypothetical protein